MVILAPCNYKAMKYRLFTLAIFVTLLAPTLGQALYFDPGDSDTTGLITGDIDSVSLGVTSPTAVALGLINTALSLLAAVCVGLLLYAGFLWVWARGNQEEVTKAKDIIQGTVIGLIIVLAALGITQFVFTTVADITGATVTTTTS